jgi:hypothetical protein
MARATQLLAYHGRTALLLGPMPRRAIPAVANLSSAIRPLVDVSDYRRNATISAATGMVKPAQKKLSATTAISVGPVVPATDKDAGFALLLRVVGQQPITGRPGKP